LADVEAQAAILNSPPTPLPTPSFGCAISEETITSAAEKLVSSGLRDLGYTCASVRPPEEASPYQWAC
jgi:hypothetical protein